MSFQEKNIVISLATFTLIMAIFLVSVAQMIQGDGLQASAIYRLWGVIVLLATVGTVGLTIATHVVGSAVLSRATGRPQPIPHLMDERDQLIMLRGTAIAYRASSIGVALAMLTLVLGQPPLVMFLLLIFFGLLAQILADLARLHAYRSAL
jgi:hypothetical protein